MTHESCGCKNTNGTIWCERPEDCKLGPQTMIYDRRSRRCKVLWVSERDILDICSNWILKQQRQCLVLPVWSGLPDGAELQYLITDQSRQHRSIGFVCSHPDWPEVPEGAIVPDAEPEGHGGTMHIAVKLEYVRHDDETPVYRVSGTTLDEQIENAMLGVMRGMVPTASPTVIADGTGSFSQWEGKLKNLPPLPRKLPRCGACQDCCSREPKWCDAWGPNPAAWNVGDAVSFTTSDGRKLHGKIYTLRHGSPLWSVKTDDGNIYAVAPIRKAVCTCGEDDGPPSLPHKSWCPKYGE